MESSTAITTDVIKTYFRVRGVTLALDGSEDYARCTHNFVEDDTQLLQQQRDVWEAAQSDVTLPPLQITVVSDGDGLGTNPITASEKEPGAKLLPSSSGGNSGNDGKRQRCRVVGRDGR